MATMLNGATIVGAALLSIGENGVFVFLFIELTFQFLQLSMNRAPGPRHLNTAMSSSKEWTRSSRIGWSSSRRLKKSISSG